MRILPIHVIPIFMGQEQPGQVGAQLRSFDVFYKTAPVVGFHVVGCEGADDPAIGFSVTHQDEEGVMGFDVTAPHLTDHAVGFSVEGEDKSPEAVMGFDVTNPEAQEVAAGLTVTSGAPDEEQVVGFGVTSEDNDSDVIGFFVGDER